MADIQTNEPFEIEAGSTLQWRREDLTDYPASEGWELSYAFVKADSPLIEITATADGNFFEVDVSASVTSNYAAGSYMWQAYATKGVERFSVDQGSAEIIENFATQTSGFDARSDAQKIFEATEAMILEKATNDQKSYSLEGRSLDRYGPGEIVKIRDKYKSIWDGEIAKEKIANGLKSGEKIKTFFVAP